MRARYALLVFALTFAVYAPTLSGGFYFDDIVIFMGHQVEALAKNPFQVFSGEGLQLLPGAPRSAHTFLLLLIYKAFGAVPFVYHLFNLLAHSLTAVLVYYLIHRLSQDSGKVALAGGLVFGLHPIHMENIAMVTLGGTDLFYGLFAVLSLLAYISFRRLGREPDGGGEDGFSASRIMMLALSVVTYVLAILSKEAAVTFVAVYPLAEFAFGRRGYLWVAPYAAIAVLLKWGVVAGPGIKAVSTAVSTSGGAAGPVKSLGFFIKSLVIPYPQSPLYSEFYGVWALYLAIAAAAVVLAISLAAARRRRLVVFYAGFFVAAALPYLFVPMKEGMVAVTAERYVYVSSIAFSGAVAIAAGRLADMQGARRPVVMVMVLLLSVYALLGVNYYFDAWTSEGAFWRRVIRTNPEYVTGYMNLAAVQLDEGDRPAAIASLEKALASPKGPKEERSQAAYNLGALMWTEGRLDKAESYYLLSTRFASFEFAYIDLGYLYLETGSINRAIIVFERAVSFPTKNPRALYGLARAYMLSGRTADARRYAQMVIEKGPGGELEAFSKEIIAQTEGEGNK